jgi:hypothetical protein
LQIPLDKKIKELIDIPYTISFVIKKRLQIDNLNELPREKRPPEALIWNGNPEDIENWIGRVMNRKSTEDTSELIILDREIE